MLRIKTEAELIKDNCRSIDDERYLQMTPIMGIAAVKFPTTSESAPSIKLSIKITRHPYLSRTVFVSIREQVDC